MKTKFTSQRKGAVLMTVVVVSVMMMVIIAAATSLVNHTNVRTNEEYRKKQAYYVASSCLRGFVAETTGFTKNATNDDALILAKINELKSIVDEDPIQVKIEKIGAGSSEDISISQPRWSNAKCEIKVERVNPTNNNYLKVISTATYLGQDNTVVAYLSAQPMRMHTFTPKALELIGTDGGITSRFENIQVYGATGATDPKSHDNNTVYKFNHNDNKLFGNTDINGSMAIQNQNRFKSNPYYLKDVDDSKGCVLNVSRSLVFNQNEPTFEPDFKKMKDSNNDPTIPEYNYNYLNVREALVFTSNNARVGRLPGDGATNKGDEYQVDTYASMIYIGKYNDIPAGMKSAMAESCAWGEDQYWDAMGDAGWGHGQGNGFNGNVYTYDLDGKAFNGDMVVLCNGTQINGDLYLSGDLYLRNIGDLTCKAIHLMGDHHVYVGIDREFDGTGGIKKPTSAIKDNDLGSISVTHDDWTGIPRANRPTFPQLSETPYYYYPEHLLCEPGYSNNVSTIWAQYKEMYKETNRKELDTSKIKDVTDPDYANTEGKVFVNGDGSDGAIFKPDYIVTDDCYIDKLRDKKILIDVDASGKDNIVVVLKNGGVTTNQNVILVKNSTKPDEEGAKFCYFVSDSGFGETEDDYGKNGIVSTYDHSTFNEKPEFTFAGTKEVIMDLDAFLHCDVVSWGSDCKGNGGSLNPTKDRENPGYLLPSNNIIMLFTEGSHLLIHESNLLIHASIYMPKAIFETTNRGGMCKIDPYYSDSDLESLGIIGNLVCNRYEVNKGNRNAIVYNSVSPYSMLSCIKGTGEEHASTSFMLDYYDNH